MRVSLKFPCLAAGILALWLMGGPAPAGSASPAAGASPAAEATPELSKLMEKMEIAYTELVKLVLVSPVSEDEVPFDQAAGWAEEIVKVTSLFPKVKDLGEDESFRDFARRAQAAAREIVRLAKKKEEKKMLGALLGIREACRVCHAKHRL